MPRRQDRYIVQRAVEWNPTGEAQQRETTAHVEVHKNGGVGKETVCAVESETYWQKAVRCWALVNDLMFHEEQRGPSE